jgi:hypothetical protein
MADTTGGFADTRMAQLRAEGEVAMTGPNPPPRTYARHFRRKQPAPAFLYEQIRASIHPGARPQPWPNRRAGPGVADTHPADRREHDVIAPPAVMKMFQSYIRMRVWPRWPLRHSVYFENPRPLITPC